MILQVGVKVFLKNAAGKYLLLQRSLEKYPEVPNRWDIIGGRIEPGTPLLENLEREVLEETGLKMTSTPKLIAAQDILRIADKHVVRLTYTANTTGEPILSDEHDAYGWYSIAEMHALVGFDMYAEEILSLVA